LMFGLLGVPRSGEDIEDSIKLCLQSARLGNAEAMCMRADFLEEYRIRNIETMSKEQSFSLWVEQVEFLGRAAENGYTAPITYSVASFLHQQRILGVMSSAEAKILRELIKHSDERDTLQGSITTKNGNSASCTGEDNTKYERTVINLGSPAAAEDGQAVKGGQSDSIVEPSDSSSVRFSLTSRIGGSCMEAVERAFKRIQVELNSGSECAGCGKRQEKGGAGGTNDRSPYLFVCGGCHKAKYCSKECQRLHWDSHRSTCHRERKKHRMSEV
jgi:hypothetical protein